MKERHTINSNNRKDDYISKSQRLLNKYNIKIGDKVEIISNKGNYRGIIMPRYESFDDDHIVIKLKSGYNIGLLEENIIDINKDSIENPKNVSLNKLSKYKESINFVMQKETEIKSDDGFALPSLIPKILLLSTGGTIASKIDYRTGGVSSLLGASELYEIFPEISNYASIYPEFLFNEYSENINPDHWSLLCERISYAILHEHFDGIIISHGTDTIHYTSSALSFAFQNLPIPVVLVGSERS